MIATIVIAAGLACLVALAVKKRVKDFREHKVCGGCMGCSGGTCGSSNIEYKVAIPEKSEKYMKNVVDLSGEFSGE